MEEQYEKLEELHAWVQAQQFCPPRWMRSADLQTSWYVIREVASGLRTGRIGPKQIWQYIEGQQEDRILSASPADLEERPPSAAVSEGRRLTPHHDLRAEAVELPFESGGFLTAALGRAGNNRRLAILFHGLEGSVEATYMRGTARELLKRGIAVLRVNMINCGGSEACTRLFYHAGFTRMLEVAVHWSLRRGFQQIVLLGFSLGGNLVLKYLGGASISVAREIAGGIAVSAPIDLAQSAASIDRARNKFYCYRFLKSMFRTMRRKQELFPDLFPHALEWVGTIAEFDHRYTAPANGFSSGGDYYRKASSLPSLCAIRRPTLILQSQDDIFIPFEILKDFNWGQNPFLIPLLSKHGGHLGFHLSAKENWMEPTVADFCQKLMDTAGS
ncbi:MAG: alpha/beta fold hydrolase [Acidobacteria bacterium]|nr:alpha/beta fold hydrolase [Acidobacteriota bacterium]